MPRIKAGPISLNYEIHGAGEPLLLIMGFAMPGALWKPQLKRLADFKCIIYDNRGTGESDRPDEPVYQVPTMADDASNLLNVLGIPRAKIFGVSMGGMIAQELTLRHPEQVEKAVLGCTIPGGPHSKLGTDARLVAAVEGMREFAGDPERAFDKIMPMFSPPEVWAARPELRAEIIAALKSARWSPPETFDRAMAGIIQFDAYERLGQIKCPVLIVHGDQDIGVPVENARTLKSRIPHAELFIVRGAGHHLEAADPDAVLSRVGSWLQT
ncbi:MAG TPA: alpha/beta hydrolase [Candidatus Binataceae bacterium]